MRLSLGFAPDRTRPGVSHARSGMEYLDIGVWVSGSVPGQVNGFGGGGAVRADRCVLSATLGKFLGYFCIPLPGL